MNPASATAFPFVTHYVTNSPGRNEVCHVLRDKPWEEGA